MAYTQVTRAQFRSLLIERMDAAALTFWRTTEYNFLIQESLRFWNLLTGYWKTRKTFTTTANTVWYALPGGLTSNMRVAFQSKPLVATSLYDLDFGRPFWESETTASGGDVPTQPQLFAPGGINLIAIWPADAVGNHTLTVDGIASTPILTLDTDFIDLGQEEMKILLDYCQHVVTFKSAGKEFEETSDNFKAFMQAAGERSAILRASATYRAFMGLDKARRLKPQMTQNQEVGAR